MSLEVMGIERRLGVRTSSSFVHFHYFTPTHPLGASTNAFAQSSYLRNCLHPSRHAEVFTIMT